jgi:DNA-binding response OmpR family regulator
MMSAHRLFDPAIVLIAEGDDMIAELLALVVEQSGAVPLVAFDARQALMLARTRCPALLIAESTMPELAGAALIAAVRAECGARLPTILVAAPPISQAQTVGADAVLSKPFHIATLEAQLSRFLAPRRSGVGLT